MKQTLLLLILLNSVIGFSKSPAPETITNPSIGVKLTGFYFGPNSIQYNVSIKNTGDEILFNVNVIDASPSGGGTLSAFNTIPSLQPGEEVIDIPLTKYDALPCFDQSMVLVQSFTAGGTPINDLSSDPNGYDNNGILGSYYNDFPTQISNYSYNVYATQNGIYQDLNNNSIVDVGDAINYTYTIMNMGSSSFTFSCEIVDSNANVTNPYFDFDGNFYATSGIHYLTIADVDLGYVYNSSFVVIPGSCIGGFNFNDETPCSGCPNPGGANIVTQLTSLLPNKISGTVKFNTNADCSAAAGFPNRRITATQGQYEYTTFTNVFGNYSILIPNSGTYVTSATSSLPNIFSSTPGAATIVSSGSNTDYANTDFCISSTSNDADLRVNLFNTDQAIPGFAVHYRLYYENTGSTSLSGAINLTLPPNVLLNFNANPMPDSVAGNTDSWNYSNLLPFERKYIEIAMLVNIPPIVNAGDFLTLTAEGTPLSGDNNPANNTVTLNQKVFSSFDPNDKTVLEGATITAEQAVGYLTYVTRFQNTGSANATTVVVKETLDADLDWSTFEPIDASHNANIQLRDGNDLTYTFPNIGLPYEAANEPASHGWFAYRIKPKSSFAIGDTASSSSAIYFDFNAPVLTNTVNTQIAPLATADFIKNNFVVYPNPAHDFINIENKNHLPASYLISDSNGKLLQTSGIENSKTIDVSQLQPGFYFLSIKTNDEKVTYKLIRK